MQSQQEIERKLFLQPLSDITNNMAYSRRLERTWQFIENYYSNPALNLKDAARAIGLSQNHLNQLLRKTTNFTFYQLLTRYRLLNALSMMNTKNYSILEVAMKNGFGSLNSFERHFRHILGITPREFRKKGLLVNNS